MHVYIAYSLANSGLFLTFLETKPTAPPTVIRKKNNAQNSKSNRQIIPFHQSETFSFFILQAYLIGLEIQYKVRGPINWLKKVNKVF